MNNENVDSPAHVPKQVNREDEGEVRCICGF